MVDLEKARYPRLHRQTHTTNTNKVVALAQAGNWGQAGLAVGLGWQVGVRLTDNLSAISCATIMNSRWDLLLTLKFILIIRILFDLFCYFSKIYNQIRIQFLILLWYIMWCITTKLMFSVNLYNSWPLQKTKLALIWQARNYREK